MPARSLLVRRGELDCQRCEIIDHTESGGSSVYTSTVLRGTEIGTATPTSHRPSGSSSVTADAVMRVATSAGANREFAVRHPHHLAGRLS